MTQRDCVVAVTNTGFLKEICGFPLISPTAFQGPSTTTTGLLRFLPHVILRQS